MIQWYLRVSLAVFGWVSLASGEFTYPSPIASPSPSPSPRPQECPAPPPPERKLPSCRIDVKIVYRDATRSRLSDKLPLIWGGALARSLNYTNFYKGITGISVDYLLHENEYPGAKFSDATFVDGSKTTAEIETYVLNFSGNDNRWATWLRGPQPMSGSLTGDSLRLVRHFSVDYPDDAHSKKWTRFELQGLPVNLGSTCTDDPTTPSDECLVTCTPELLPGQTSATYFFGNAPGETFNSTSHFAVDLTDELLVRANASNLASFVPANDNYDFNKDLLVNATDQMTVRRNYTDVLNRLAVLHPLPDRSLAVNSNIVFAPFSGGMEIPGLFVSDIAKYSLHLSTQKYFPKPLTVAQDDGKVLLVGSKLARYLPDLAIDPSFGVGGFANVGTLYPMDIALQSTGKILVSEAGGIRRFHANGQLDNSFFIDYASFVSAGFTVDHARQIEVDSSDRIFVTGKKNGIAVLLGLQANGQVDSQFGFVPVTTFMGGASPNLSDYIYKVNGETVCFGGGGERSIVGNKEVSKSWLICGSLSGSTVSANSQGIDPFTADAGVNKDTKVVGIDIDLQSRMVYAVFTKIVSSESTSYSKIGVQRMSLDTSSVETLLERNVGPLDCNRVVVPLVAGFKFASKPNEGFDWISIAFDTAKAGASIGKRCGDVCSEFDTDHLNLWQFAVVKSSSPTGRNFGFDELKISRFRSRAGAITSDREGNSYFVGNAQWDGLDAGHVSSDPTESAFLLKVEGLY